MEQRTDGTSRVYLPRYVAASGHERKKETKKETNVAAAVI